MSVVFIIAGCVLGVVWYVLKNGDDEGDHPEDH